MSDHFAAEIAIGGCIPRRKVQFLCAAIREASVALEWGGGEYCAGNAQELLESAQDHDGVRILWLCDAEARWGQFAELEQFLVANQLAFSRKSESRYEYDAERVEFRPGREPVSWVTNVRGEQVIATTMLAPALKQLDLAAKQLGSGKVRPALRAVVKTQRLLQQALPPQLPALEEFSIGD